jgi:DNA-binding MarR family transcriptional regulator
MVNSLPYSKPPPEPTTAIDLTRLIPMAGFLLRLSQLRVYDAFHAELGRLNMTPARYSLLAVLHDNPCSRSGQIADALRVKHSNMAALLTQLEGDGLIQRLPDPSERRASLVRLTDAGEALFAEVDPVVHALEAQLIEGLTETARAALLSQLAHLAGLG